jgi:hypothetical protein
MFPNSKTIIIQYLKLVILEIPTFMQKLNESLEIPEKFNESVMLTLKPMPG